MTVGFTQPPDITSTITTLSAFSYTDYFDIPILPYKAYDPYRFLLSNTLYGKVVHAFSGPFGIYDTAEKIRQIWALDHPAPMGHITDSFHGSSAAGVRLSGAAIMRLIGLTYVNIILVGRVL